MDPATDKAALRTRIRSRLRELDGASAIAASQRISSLLSDRLLKNLAAHASPILSFAPIRRTHANGAAIVEEVDLTALHHTLIERGLLALPRIDWENRAMQAMRFVPAASLDEATHLEVRRFDVPEPRGGEPVSASALRSVLVPGLAFDRSGARLGRGAGYYDRYLEAVGPETQLIGVCFDAQVVDRVPTESHDRRVDTLVTERGWVECGSSPQE